MVSARKIVPIVRRVLEKGKRVLLVTDFDGTLCQFVPKPADAYLTAEHRQILKRLHGRPVQLCIITGRGMRDIKRRVGVKHIGYSGNCGLEIKYHKHYFLHPGAKARRQKLKELAHELRRAVYDIPTFGIQDKTWSLGLPEPVGLDDKTRHLLHERLRKLRHDRRFRQVRWVPRGAAWEIMPNIRWDKGKAAEFLWKRFHKPFVIAMGDDEIDEPMFKFANRHGVSIRVGGRKPSWSAKYFVKDVPEAFMVLRLLAHPDPGIHPRKK